jgi:hypothetical protein
VEEPLVDILMKKMERIGQLKLFVEAACTTIGWVWAGGEGRKLPVLLLARSLRVTKGEKLAFAISDPFWEKSKT